MRSSRIITIICYIYIYGIWICIFSYTTIITLSSGSLCALCPIVVVISILLFLLSLQIESHDLHIMDSVCVIFFFHSTFGCEPYEYFSLLLRCAWSRNFLLTSSQCNIRILTILADENKEGGCVLHMEWAQSYCMRQNVRCNWI